MSLLQTFKGATLYFAESKHISVEAAEEDQTEEEESLLNSFDVDDHEAAGTLRFSTTNADTANQFKEFCVTIDKVQVASEIDKLFPDLPAEFPMWIALWIMDK
ncbi:hypothetical protein EV424DRAFT_1546222 [Suillus variegatus]|nr:hypothetical protein EV424DRAFT_1546222 [Suillus variegatus]